MTRWGRWLAGAALAITPAAALTTGDVARAEPAVLQIVAQDLTVAANGTLTMTLRLPAMDEVTAAEADIVVTAYRRVDTRMAVRAAIAGMLPQALDAVDIPVSEVAPAPAAGSEVSLAMPIETNTRSPEGLQLSNPGLYPVVVDVRAGGDPVASIVTFVDRLEVTPPQPYVTLPVSLAMTVDEPVEIDVDGTIIIDDGDVARYAALVTALEASAIPATVRIPPQAITALQSRDPSLADRLVVQLGRGTVVTQPDPPLDPSAAAADGLDELYATWLADGERVLGGELPAPASTRRWAFVDRDTSSAGAALLRDMGATTLLMPAAMAERVTSSTRIDPTMLSTVAVDGNARIDVLTADPRMGELLTRPQSTPRQTAIYAVADLLAARSEILLFGGDPQRHGVLLGVGNLETPWSTSLRAVTELIVATPQLAATSVESMVDGMDHQLVDGVQLTGSLDGSATVDLEPRINLMWDLSVDTFAVGSMLPVDDGRRAGWALTIARMPSTGLSSDQVTEMSTGINDEMASIRGAVEVPEPFTFTLTGQRSTIRFNFQNTSDTPLTVLARVSSPKLTFPDGEQLVVLAPNASTQLAVPVEARASGDFGVALDVFTPEGEQRLAPSVPLTASLTAISGLGNFITGVALLLLATWWVRHFLQQRRAKLTASVRDRHPAGRDPSGDDTVVREPAAEIAGSTLPPS